MSTENYDVYKDQSSAKVITSRRPPQAAAEAAGAMVKLVAPKVGGATLSDGSTVDADLVLSAIGLRPRVELARAAGATGAPIAGAVDEPIATLRPRRSPWR